MDLTSRTLWTLRHYWGDRLGVTPTAFEESGETVGSADEGGIQLFYRDGGVVVGVPKALLDTVAERTDELAGVDGGDSDRVAEWLTHFDGVNQVLGPSFYGYTDRETFIPVESNARVLTSADNSSFRAFQRDIPDTEWEHGGTQFTPGETVGIFVDEDLVAIAGYDVWDELLAHLAVVTHPDHRGQRYGRAVVSRATERALADGLLPQYRTSDAWPWSVTLARKLGFHRFSTAYLGVEQQ